MSFISFLPLVCQKYNLGQLKHWSRIRLGLINTKYLIKTTRGKFVVRLSARTRKQLAFEVALLNHVRSLPVPQLMPYAKNKFISLHQGTPLVVYKYIEGKIPKKITPSLLRQIGLFQAKFHLFGRNFKTKINREPYTYHFPKKKIMAFHRAIAHKIPREFRKQYEVIRRVLLAINVPKSLPKGPIHVDIKPENVLVEKGKVMVFLDFDNGYIGPYIIDMGKTITWFCIKKGKVNKKFFIIFLKSYQQKRQLSIQEKNFLNQSIIHAVASHIFLDYYKYTKKIIPYAYLKMLHQEFYPILESTRVGEVP